MNPLLEKFPESVNINGIECRISPGFHTVLYCNELIEGIPEKEDIPEEILLKMLKAFYPKVHLFTEEHLNRMFWFFTCGREKEKRKFPRKAAGINSNKPFDFKEDAELIYAGFIQQYGIDLQETDMHWWKFKSLLDGLTNETKFMQVVGYRLMDISKIKDKNERKRLKELQDYYAIRSNMPVQRTQEEIERELFERLGIAK